MTAAEPPASGPRPLAEIFLVFLRLGLTSFGGPIAISATSARRSWRGAAGRSG
jgi:hypothetical protein